MNIMLICGKRLMQILRDYKAMSMFVLLPLLMAFIMGKCFAASFSQTVSFKDLKVLYLDNGAPAKQPVMESLLKVGGDYGIRFEKTNRRKDGIERVKSGDYTGFVCNTSQGLVFYKNDRTGLEASLVEGMLNAVQRRINAIASIGGMKSLRSGKSPMKEPLIRETVLNRQRAPRALDYFGIILMVLIIMYHALHGFYAIKGEILSHTAGRLLASPVRKFEILAGNVLGTCCGSMLQFLVYFFVGKMGLGIDWGNDPATVIGLVSSEVIMAVSIGVGIAFLIRSEIVVNNLLNLAIPVLGFLGGCYVSVEQMGKAFLPYTNLSPLRWLNQALFQVIYSDNYRLVIPTLIINLSIAALFLGVASRFTRKEAFLK